MRFERMHRVQTRIRRTPPDTFARTVWRFGSQTLLVRLWAWLMLWPRMGFFPQISHTLAIP